MFDAEKVWSYSIKGAIAKYSLNPDKFKEEVAKIEAFIKDSAKEGLFQYDFVVCDYSESFMRLILEYFARHGYKVSCKKDLETCNYEVVIKWNFNDGIRNY